MRLIAWLLERFLGRLPIGSLQLVHNKARLLAAVAGVTFANVLVLMQLGFLGALVGSIRVPYEQMNADLMISASDMNTLADGSPLPRQRLFQALAIQGVESATPLYYAGLAWKQPDGSVRTLDLFGVDPAADTFKNDSIRARLSDLLLSDHALLDRGTRNVPKEVFNAIDQGRPLVFESHGRTLTVIGTFAMGGGFAADGCMIVSDQTFLKLFPDRVSGAPNHVLLRLKPGVSQSDVLGNLRAVIPTYDSVVRTIAEAMDKDQVFQTTQRPVGVVFGFGIVIGLMVGIIIVYQVLVTDVADHMKEYATFKAIGYAHAYFLGIIFEEATALATLGFIPGLGISLLFYKVIAGVTGLPLHMTVGRAAGVLLGTLVMCGLSGALATRRLARANPAELF